MALKSFLGQSLKMSVFALLVFCPGSQAAIKSEGWYLPGCKGAANTTVVLHDGSGQSQEHATIHSGQDHGVMLQLTGADRISGIGVRLSCTSDSLYRPAQNTSCLCGLVELWQV